MPIVVNLDMLLVKRKMSQLELSERIRDNASESLNPGNKQGESDPLFNAGIPVQGTELSARRSSRVYSRQNSHDQGLILYRIVGKPT